jgi:cytochrome c
MCLVAIMRNVTLFLVYTCLATQAMANGTGNVARGFTLVKQNCGVCHAIGRDDESSHPDAPPFRFVFRTYAASNLQEALAEGLVTGHPDMPEFIFPAQDVQAIVDYLSTLEGL